MEIFYKKSLLVGYGLSHIIHVVIHFSRMTGVMPVGDLDGLAAAEASFALPDWSAPTQAWIFL